MHGVSIGNLHIKPDSTAGNSAANTPHTKDPQAFAR
ncbi:hypothetical protein YPPY47_3024, partial [Yersinia pestis PY-47]